MSGIVVDNLSGGGSAPTDQQVLSAFGQGQGSARRGGYLSDNPHPYASEPWAVWREGFQFEQRENSREK